MRGFDDQEARELDLLAEGLGESFERELGGAVRTEPGRRDLTSDARHLHHPAGPLPAHVRQSRPGQRRRSEEVQLEQVAQLRVGRLLERADLRPSRVVDEHVKPAEAIDDLLNDLEGTFGVGDVECDRAESAWVLAGQFVQPLDPAGGPDDEVTPGERHLGQGAPEPGARAGDEPDSIVWAD
jgi:hypothetical protein